MNIKSPNMIFELNIEYEKRINDIYSKVTARQTYNATSTAELDRALKTALKLITENHAVIEVNTVTNVFDRSFVCRFYDSFDKKYGYCYNMSDYRTNNISDLKLSDIKKTIKNAVTNVFEKCLFYNAEIDPVNAISYIILDAALKDINKIDKTIWKGCNGSIEADRDFIYNAYINYLMTGNTNTEEIRFLKRLLNYDNTNSSPHANIIKKQLEKLPEVMTA